MALQLKKIATSTNKITAKAKTTKRKTQRKTTNKTGGKQYEGIRDLPQLPGGDEHTMLMMTMMRLRLWLWLMGRLEREALCP